MFTQSRLKPQSISTIGIKILNLKKKKKKHAQTEALPSQAQSGALSHKYAAA